MTPTTVAPAFLTVALPKGQLFAPCASLFQQLGAARVRDLAESRRLLVEEPALGLRFIAVKAVDVPVYVERGAADLGIAGSDVIEETQRDLYLPLYLGFGRCRLVVAAPRDKRLTDLRLRPTLRVATKYPHLARQHFLARGLSIEIVELSGSVELGPRAGLADLIVDIVDTGRTLKENGLSEMETIMESQACLIVNRASHKVHQREIGALITRLERSAQAAPETSQPQPPETRNR
ncbi:MAG: ATP phosphoribosyltransferase [Chloroflexota bacterium]|nr:ATP phosphoribosyltransferase [Chloroflexota bacterium]